jgi:hypothetical protein
MRVVLRTTSHDERNESDECNALSGARKASRGKPKKIKKSMS